MASISDASTDRRAARTADAVDRHQSSASCSCQPGRGSASPNSARPSATARPSRFQTTALVAVVDESTPRTYAISLVGRADRLAAEEAAPRHVQRTLEPDDLVQVTHERE